MIEVKDIKGNIINKGSDIRDFGWMLKQLRKGERVKLPYWSDDVFIHLQVPDEYSKMTSEYLYVKSRFGRVPWNPTQIEILSDKWEIC